MGIITVFATLAFAVIAIIVLNIGTADKEFKRRQSHWDKYQDK